MYATAEIQLAASPDALTVPVAAVVRNGREARVCLVESGTITYRPVTLGLRQGDRVEVQSGLTEDAMIVLARADGLRAGQAVDLINPKQSLGRAGQRRANEGNSLAMPRILVVEDEPKLLRSIQRRLEMEGYETIAAETGEQGYRCAMTEDVDAVVLDLLLPERDGMDVLRDLRKRRFTKPVLILTARDTTEDLVTGLDSGADDYVIKPFSYVELLARLRALLRRSSERETVLRVGDLELDVVTRRVLRGGTELTLTHREFDVLEYLVRRANTTVPREMMARDIWKEPTVVTNAIEVCINGLRKKVEIPGTEPLIHTVRGVGYEVREPG